MYIGSNTEACSCNHCYSGKSISITYSECVFVALGIRDAMRMCPIFFCGLSGCTKLFHIISQTACFSEKKVIKNITCVSILSTNSVSNISHSKKKWARFYQTCMLVFKQSTRYSCQIVMKLECSQYILEKHSNIKILWKSIQWEPRCSMRRDRWTDRERERGRQAEGQK